MKPKSEAVFHFTRELGTLLHILQSGFWPRYCLEELSWTGMHEVTGNRLHVALPMACFCDIPLSRIFEHTEYYGKCGIGMSQEWAIRQGLNPVLYIAGYSNVYHCIVNMAQWERPVSGDANKEENTDREYRHLLSFIKPLRGEIKVQGSTRKKDFYQENEWRYVPFDKNIKDYLKKEEFEDEIVSERNNATTKQLCSLKFSINDIKHLIVESDRDVPELIKQIEDIFHDSDRNGVKILISKISSLERLDRDY